MVADFCSQIILQKSLTVSCLGPACRGKTPSHTGRGGHRGSQPLSSWPWGPAALRREGLLCRPGGLWLLALSHHSHTPAPPIPPHPPPGMGVLGELLSCTQGVTPFTSNREYAEEAWEYACLRVSVVCIHSRASPSVSVPRRDRCRQTQTTGRLTHPPCLTPFPQLSAALAAGSDSGPSRELWANVPGERSEQKIKCPQKKVLALCPASCLDTDTVPGDAAAIL